MSNLHQTSVKTNLNLAANFKLQISHRHSILVPLTDLTSCSFKRRHQQNVSWKTKIITVESLNVVVVVIDYHCSVIISLIFISKQSIRERLIPHA